MILDRIEVPQRKYNIIALSPLVIISYANMLMQIKKK